MNTTKNTRQTGAATAILLGFVLALTPVTAHAGQTGAAAAMVPTGPDIALSATDNLQHGIEQAHAPKVLLRPADKTLRQVMEEDRAPKPPTLPADKTLRQVMEEDRAPEASPRPADKTLRQLMEEDRR